MTRRASLLVTAAVIGMVACSTYGYVTLTAPRVEGGATDDTRQRPRPAEWSWELYIHVPGDRIEYRFHADQPFIATSAPRVEVPAAVARIDRLAPVPIEIRYVDFLGLHHQRTAIFDVPRGVSRQTKAYLHEAVSWVILVRRPTAGAAAHALFNVQSDECSTVHYGIDSNVPDRTLERYRTDVELAGDPRSITMRIDFCDGSSSETTRDHARADADRYQYVEPERLAPRSKGY